MTESLPHGLRRARPVHGARDLYGHRVPVVVALLEQPRGRMHLVLWIGEHGDPVILPRHAVGRLILNLHLGLEDLAGESNG